MAETTRGRIAALVVATMVAAAVAFLAAATFASDVHVVGGGLFGEEEQEEVLWGYVEAEPQQGLA